MKFVHISADIVAPSLSMATAMSESGKHATCNANRSTAERIMMLGGVSMAMLVPGAEMTVVARPARRRKALPFQIFRLLHPDGIVLKEVRTMAQSAFRIGKLPQRRPRTDSINVY